MKFVGLRKFTGKSFEQLQRYVSVELGKALSDAFTGLSHLRFVDNFDCFYEDIVDLPATSNITFRNRLSTPDIIWFVVRMSYDGSGTVNGLVETAVKPITARDITLRNTSGQVISATVLVMRK